MGWRPPTVIRASAWLEENEVPVFYEQSAVDQHHAQQVAEWLLSKGHQDRVLVRAALLHDVGKACANITVVHRIVWVIGLHLGDAFGHCLARKSRVFQALLKHAELGASRLRGAQADPRVVALVAGQPLPGDEERGELLRQADNAI